MQQPQIEPSSIFGGTLTPGVVTVNNAYLSKPAFDRETETYTGTVYNGRGALVPEALRPGAFAHLRPVDPISIKRSEVTAERHIETAIYGGHFFFAWGHFLIETLAAAANTKLPLNAPVIFHPWNVTFENKWADAYLQHVRPVLDAAWEDRDIIVSRGTLSVATLKVPRRLTAFGMTPKMIHPTVGDVFARVRAKLGSGSAAKRIIVVRESSHRRAVADEAKIYHHFISNGFTGIRPHEMTATDQVRAMAGAEIVVGFNGSALHTAAFTPPGSYVVEIGDIPGRDFPNRAQADIAKIVGQSLHFVPAYGADGNARPSALIVSEIERCLASGYPNA